MRTWVGGASSEALNAGADVVICPRVTDASLVVGPAAWWHGWDRTDYDELAGAVVAGHIIECGPQATGGNYSWLGEIMDRRYPGFPVAEVESDGSTVITKHDNTGGLVSTGTVTAQLLYEIAGPDYLNPDVVAQFDTLRLEDIGTNRVRVAAHAATPPPRTLKVAMNYAGGYRNTMTLVITGLDIEEKAAWAEQELFDVLGGKSRFGDVDVRLLRFDHKDARSNEQATAHLRITVKDAEARKVGRAFSNAVMELVLAGYVGLHTTTPPVAESAFGIYWPTLVDAELVEQVVTLPDGSRQVVTHSCSFSAVEDPVTIVDQLEAPSTTLLDPYAGARVWRPLGDVCAARSGDKGGNANVGVWTRDAMSFAWLRSYLSVEQFRQLIPEVDGLPVHRYELRNLRALNFVVVGLLGDGVAASTRPDPQAKGLGEYLRSRYVEIPEELIAGDVNR